MALLREFSKFLGTHTHGTDHSTPAQARGKNGSVIYLGKVANLSFRNSSSS